MDQFINADSKNGFNLKLWRGERTVLIGMDVYNPADDFVGFAIECQPPGSNQFTPLGNRLNFSYDTKLKKAVTGAKIYPSTEAPFQKFRWVHFPENIKPGSYTYRVSMIHMPADGNVVAGDSLTLDIPLDSVIYENFLDVGFTRNFASSQAYAEKYGNNPNVIPGGGQDPLTFKKVKGDVYQWLGFEAYELIFGFIDEIVKDKTLSLDVFAYDLNECDIVDKLEQIGSRLRIIIDDSKDHKGSDTPETNAGDRFTQAGATVKRAHFSGLQHNKVLIARKGGKPIKVLFGSTNFSYRGIYIQANNALVLYAPEAAQYFQTVFDAALAQSGKALNSNAIFKKWQLVPIASKPPTHLCFSPHSDAGLSLNPVGAAIDQATSSVFFAIAFLNQMTSGPTFEAINGLMDKDVFSYGISNRVGGLKVLKPDGSIGLVDFEYLAATAPQPFAREWSGMAKSAPGKKSAPGISEHNKFVVTDFSLPTAKVFTGSSNLSVSGEEKNGDNLVMIEDTKVATSYAIEAVRIFDHLHFRTLMQKGLKDQPDKGVQVLTLKKPSAISGQPSWFGDYYQAGSQKARDRQLFSH